MRINRIITVCLFFIACSDETTEIISQTNRDDIEIFAAEADLPECGKDNEGEQAFVKGEIYARICVGKKWTSMPSTGKDTVYLKKENASCHTEELADKQGVKIVCGGDSLGVLLNVETGPKGVLGEAGADCSLKRIDSATIRVYCSGDSTTLYLGVPPDAECGKAPVSLDSLVGYVQKGPFVKGAEVSLYELVDGCSLEKTGKVYQGEILDDKGLYKIPKVKLSCQYAVVKAKGYYRNEVTGKKSEDPIELSVLVDLRSQKNVNLNVLTHLEYERVTGLVAEEGYSLQNAMDKAHREIMGAFQIKADKAPENMNIFGDAEEDASLLAISVLLRNNQKESEFVDFLKDVILWIGADGVWRNNADKAYVVDWGLLADANGELPGIRKNVEEISATVPAFENYLRRFVGVESGLGVCGSDAVPKGMVRNVTNRYSSFYATSYSDTVKSNVRFICANSDGVGWRVATDIEKDTMGTDFKNTKDGTFLKGLITGRRLVWDADTLRYETVSEMEWNRACVSYLRDTSMILEGQYSYYKCTDKGWEYDFDHLNFGTLVDLRDGKTYKTIGIKTQMWMAENLDFEYRVNDSLYGISRHDSCDACGFAYTWGATMDSAGVYSADAASCAEPGGCKKDLKYPVRGICPEGWHIPTVKEWLVLYYATGRTPKALEAKGYELWASATDAYGFSLIPAGSCAVKCGELGSVIDVWAFDLKSRMSGLSFLWFRGDEMRVRSDFTNLFFFIRCIKD